MLLEQRLQKPPTAGGCWLCLTSWFLADLCPELAKCLSQPTRNSFLWIWGRVAGCFWQGSPDTLTISASSTSAVSRGDNITWSVPVSPFFIFHNEILKTGSCSKPRVGGSIQTSEQTGSCSPASSSLIFLLYRNSTFEEMNKSDVSCHTFYINTPQHIWLNHSFNIYIRTRINTPALQTNTDFQFCCHWLLNKKTHSCISWFADVSLQTADGVSGSSVANSLFNLSLYGPGLIIVLLALGLQIKAVLQLLTDQNHSCY